MEKLIIVVYLQTGNLENEDYDMYINEVKKDLFVANPDAIHYVVPIGDDKTRIECINPKLVSKEEYSKTIQQLKDIEKNMNIIIGEEQSNQKITGDLDYEIKYPTEPTWFEKMVYKIKKKIQCGNW